MSRNDRIDFADLKLFLAIVRCGSFRLAAIEAGQTPSAVSHAMRRLEDRLGAKLLNRTSRAVSPTEAGLDLASRLQDGFNQIGSALESFAAPGTARLGSLRLNVFADAAHLLIAPALPEFARVCPGVQLTVVVDNRPIDIVAEGYDAGIRYGHHVPEDMIAVPLTRPQRWVMVASPAYLRKHGTPRQLGELANHECLQLLLGDNSSYRWEVDVAGRKKSIRVPGVITINDTVTTISACKAGMGIAYVLEARIADELARRTLKVVLEEHACAEDPLHIYYSSRRYNHPALLRLINLIRERQSLPKIAKVRG
ncbi:LysR substrate-binding domain-containing protein [Paraburkholderia phenoliruptrix]|uniref:LysR substrate-binding domain-containing protein n=1 Tax=Paraburkholderia phenoliruptrix TaxID=252970 RepID=UPI002862591D|nr:LysR substrate-binding domain-containing protein [Paraburkholderia phenoliruptrix]MDR6388239.1 DNA-binding transcriptional LysR family regulator [Paraburkholderia phenoliruptrix]